MLYTVVLSVQQKVLQLGSRSKFSTEIVQAISVLKEDIYWVKSGKEVLIGGKYFDVKSYQITGDRILLIGYYDHKEDKLISMFQKVFQKKDPKESTAGQTSLKLFFPLCTAISARCLFPEQPGGNQPGHWYCETLIEAIAPVFSPPPES